MALSSWRNPPGDRIGGLRVPADPTRDADRAAAVAMAGQPGGQSGAQATAS